MVSEPAKWVVPLQQAGASNLTFHIESDMPEGGPQALIHMIRKAGMTVGMVMKPGTSIECVIPYLKELDVLLIMTVEPGFSGQAFMPDMMSKVHAIRSLAPTLNVQVDGGLSPTTIATAAQAGANVIVAASAIFGSQNRQSVIDALRTSVDQHLHQQP